jgi:hypothetical protein
MAAKGFASGNLPTELFHFAFADEGDQGQRWRHRDSHGDFEDLDFPHMIYTKFLDPKIPEKDQLRRFNV